MDSSERARNPGLCTVGVQHQVLITDKQKWQEIGSSEILPFYSVDLSIYFCPVIEAEQHLSVIGHRHIFNRCQPKVRIEFRQ